MIRLTFLAAATLLAAACSDSPELTAPIAQPEQRLRTSDGPPFFTIAGNGGFLPNDGEWAALPFVRDPDCPQATSSSNLLALDFSAFACPLTVEGFDRWETGPFTDPAPRQTHYMGTGSVPIAFVLWNELSAATGDGVLTLAELLGLPSLMWGEAHFYKETDIYGVSGPLGPGRGMYKINARGMLETGGTFALHINEVLGEQRVVEIRF